MNAKLLQMTVLDSASFFTVSDEEQARLLTEPTSKEFFKPFLAQECSVTQAAEVVGCNLNTMLYRVKTLLKAGLIKVTRQEKRKGRAIKYYRSVHDSYFIPFSLTPYATLEERLEAQGEPIFNTLIRAYAAVLRQSERYGNYLLRLPSGSVMTSDLVPEMTPSGLPVFYSDTIRKLEKDEALKLAEDLRALFLRSAAFGEERSRTVHKGHDYLLMVALLPLEQ
jgi:hypothetical protein